MVYLQLDRKEVELKQKLESDDAVSSDEIISDVLKLREFFWIMKTLDWSKQITLVYYLLFCGLDFQSLDINAWW